MRVTDSALFRQGTRGLQDTVGKIARLQEQLISEKKINRPSDDPVGMRRVLHLSSLQSKINQYVRNMDRAEGFIQGADIALQNSADLLLEAQQIALLQGQGAPIVDTQSRLIAADQVDQIIDQMMRMANTQVEGEFIFSGFKTDVLPYQPDPASTTGAIAYGGDGGVIQVEIAPGVSIGRNVSGDQVFGGAAGTVDIFGVLNDLRIALRADDPTAVSNTLVTLNSAYEQVIRTMADISGARLVRMRDTREYTLDMGVTVASQLSQQEDVDLVAVASGFQFQQSLLEAIRDSTARILGQRSLLDFLR